MNGRGFWFHSVTMNFAIAGHEPPLATVLPNREEALAVTEDIHETYERDGVALAHGPGDDGYLEHLDGGA